MIKSLIFEGNPRGKLEIDKFEMTPESTNNFFLYFMPGDFGDMYREKPHYERFKKKHPELHTRLLHAFAELDEDSVVGGTDANTRNAFEKIADRRREVFEANKLDLYKAYEAMYEDTRDNAPLFR